MNQVTKLHLSQFQSACRLFVTAKLKVADGFNGRFQPTGFPDLGPALYKSIREVEEPLLDPKGKPQTDAQGKPKTQKVLRLVPMLFSDTAAALGNWLEAACLQGDDYNSDCRGIPYVRVLDGAASGEPFLTSSVREPHRLASPNVLDAKTADKKPFREVIRSRLNVNKDRPVHSWRVAQELFGLDPGCVLHGVFFGDAGLDGRLRLSRLLSGFIEAANPNQVNYGGVKRGEVSASENIPFAKQEFTSDDITASFIIHLSTLEGYGLNEDQQRFLVLWALYKIDRFLRSCLRLRSTCEFKVIEPVTASLDDSIWPWPKTADIREDFLAAKQNCFPEVTDAADPWARRRVQVVKWEEEITPTRVPLSAEIEANQLAFGRFSDRVEVKAHNFGTKGKPDTKPALWIKSSWTGENFEELDELLALFPEKLEKEDGTAADNPVHSLVKKAIQAHRKSLEKRKKGQNKTGQQE